MSPTVIHGPLPQTPPHAPPREKPVEVDEVGEVLLRAADGIRTRGWLQSDWGESEGPQCVQGHIDTVKGKPSLFVEASERLEKSLGFRAAGGAGNIAWNNAPGRTAEEVVEALERAAYGV